MSWIWPKKNDFVFLSHGHLNDWKRKIGSQNNKFHLKCKILNEMIKMDKVFADQKINKNPRPH